MNSNAPEKERGLFPTALKPANVANDSTQCSHLNTVSERLPVGHVHFGKVRCLDCGNFVRWEPKPENRERQRWNSVRLARLSMCEHLTHYERRFVRDVSKLTKLSPRQQGLIDALAAEYLDSAK